MQMNLAGTIARMIYSTTPKPPLPMRSPIAQSAEIKSKKENRKVN